MSARTCNVYTSYAFDALPEHPGESWTRFVCISDTHSRTKLPVPPGDVLIHAGDLSSWGTLPHLRTTINWLCTLPHEIKIIIAGNHDLCLDSKWKDGGLDPKEIDAAQELMRNETLRKAGIIYLEREKVEIITRRGVLWKLYGSPAAPFYVQGSFQYVSTEEAKEEWFRIPLDVEILITHTPSYGVLDKTRRGKLAGCPTLASRITELSSCRLHVFGHIHEAHGANVVKRVVVGENNEVQHVDFVSVNAATFRDSLPVLVDIRKDA